MRRALLLFLAVLLAACVGAGAVIYTASARQSAVVLTQTVSHGDAAAAAGLQLTTSVKLDNQVFWHTRFAPDGTAGPDTDFCYYTERQRDDFTRTDKGYFYLFDYARMGMSSNQPIDLDDPYDYDMPYEDWTQDTVDSVSTTLEGLAPVIKLVAENTAPGETHAETVRLADYMDYYPLAVDLRLHDQGVTYINPTNMMKELRQAFPIPVDPSDCPEISVTKDTAGNIVSLNVGGGAAGKTDELYCVNLVVEDHHIPTDTVAAKGRILFALCGTAAQKADFPGGYGIYAMPWQEAIFADLGSSFETRVFPRIEFFCPLDPEETLLWMDEFDGKLLLVTRRDDTCTLRLLDMTTGEELYALPLPQSMRDMAERTELQNLLICEEYVLVLFSDGGFALAEKAGDGLRVGLTGNYRAAEAVGLDLFYSFNATALAWDGERLAVACHDAQWYEPGGCNIHLAVFDATGLAFGGIWQNSLGRSEGYTSSDTVTMPTHAAPLVLEWLPAA